ncbi:MAG: TlpA disulfide reductase family protein [Saprospiraceae bacterium]
MSKFIQVLLGFVMAVSMLSACSSLKKGTEISGTVNNAENMSVFLDQVSLTNQSNILLTEKANDKGEFKFSLPDGLKTGIYRIRIGEQMLDLISNGKEKKVNYTGTLANLNNFEFDVQGSDLTVEYLTKVKDYINKKIDVPTLTKYTSTESDPLIGFQLAARLFTFRPEFVNLHKDVSKRLTASYPDLELSKQYTNVIAQIEQAANQQMASAAIRVGEVAPEIALPDPKGKVRKLSDYKGKVVLVDFWASWCGPCRKANPHVVEIYHKYKSKGFEVFSVSLDGMDSRTAQRFSDPKALNEQIAMQKERWISAIAQDKLDWDGHVSDLKKWECAPAQQWGVRSIPQTFLIGRDGKIVAINPRYDLEEQVQKYL